MRRIAKYPKSHLADRRRNFRDVLSAGALVAATIAALLGWAQPAVSNEVIERFESVVQVAPDGTLDVSETIRVRAEGRQIQRGIYRDFPLTFQDGSGRSRRVTFELIDVTRDGRPEPHFIRSNSKGVRIYAGNENILLKPGSYIYQIRYRTGRQIRFLDGHEELFWNATGNAWSFPIHTAHAIIRLPDGRAPTRWAAFTGRFGERGTAYSGRVLNDNTLSVTTTKVLNPGEGLSVVAQLPAGIVIPPSGARGLYYQFLDYRRHVIACLGLAGLLAFYFLTWNAVGRDPPKGTIIPLFHPPEGISPALAGYIRDWGWGSGWRKFTAGAISLAVKGIIVFDDSLDELTLRIDDQSAPWGRGNLPPGEIAILNWVRDRGGKVTIDKANGKSLATAFSAFKISIEGENRHRFFRRNLRYFIPGILLTALTLALILAFGDFTSGEMGLLMGFGFVCVFLGMFVIPLVRTVMGARNVRTIVQAGINLLVLAVFMFGFASAGTSILSSLPDNFAQSIGSGLMENGFLLALLGGFAALNGLFYYLLRAPTAAGRPVMDQIEGLELYIRTAETERLNLVGAPDITTEQFECLLPYAIALKAEKPWSQAFSAAFERAHPDEDLTSTYRPRWRGGRRFGADFSHSLTGTIGAAQGSFSSAMPAPKSSSSGFSSGGGSGGGGGGGGGGGW